jgi:hypothetical protein
MKTAGRETPNRWAKVSSNRADDAVGQNTSCSFKWAEKQEDFQALEECFSLTSPFIEQGRTYFPEPRLDSFHVADDTHDTPGMCPAKPAYLVVVLPKC